MNPSSSLRAVAIVALLVGSSLSLLAGAPVVAQPASQTTLYFTDVIPYLVGEVEDFDPFLFPPMSFTPPTSEEDARYPPDFLVRNESSLLPRYNFNLENWTTWFSTSWAFYFLEDMEGFNFSDFLDYFPGVDLSEYDINLLLPNPLRIAESFKYTGDEPLTISGDVSFTVYLDVPRHLSRYQDNVTAGLYTFNEESFIPLPKRVQNASVTIPPRLRPTVQELTITLEGVSVTLQPGESFVFTLEIEPGDRFIGSFVEDRVDMERLTQRLAERAAVWKNRTRFPSLQDLGTAIEEMLPLIQELNISSEDLAAVVNTLNAPKFLYDSIQHPTSVSLPAGLPGPFELVTYYLDNGSLSTTEPEGDGNRSAVSADPLAFTAPGQTPRSKVIRNATVDLYLDRELNFLPPDTVSVQVTLLDGDSSIATVTKDVDRSLLRGSTPVTFTLANLRYELAYGRQLRLEVAIGNGSRAGGIRSLLLLSGSPDTPSSLTVTFEETTNLRLSASSTPSTGLILPGGSIEFAVTVNGTKADEVTLEVLEKPVGEWLVEILDETPVNVSAGGSATISVLVTSGTDTMEAYGNTMNLTFVATGQTGIARQTAAVEVSRDAITYDVGIIGYPDSINVKKGESQNFYIVIRNNNTGASDDVDSYSIVATSENHWEVDYRDQIRNLRRGTATKPTDILIVAHVPENTTLESDTISVTVTSDTNPATSETVTIIVTVLGPEPLEALLEWFENVARTLGLTGPFGSYAPLVLVAIVMLILIFIIIIITLVLTRKTVRVLSPKLIQEIDASGKAVFSVSVENLMKRPHTFTVATVQRKQSPPWSVEVSPSTLALEPRQTETVTVTVLPPASAKPGDWCELELSVKDTGARRHRVSLLTLIKEGVAVLQITDVSHAPSPVTAGDSVVTSLSILNKGTIEAPHATILFYANQKKVAVLDTAIPAGGAADVDVPWVARKGKNTVRILVKST